MGVDIRGYTNIRKIEAVLDEDGEPLDPTTREPMQDALKLWVNPDYPERAADIADKGVYAYDECAGHASYGYGSYNFWRDHLAKLAGWPLGSYEQYGRSWDSHAASAWHADGGKLWELINFSDCEGTIGPAACTKIAAELREIAATDPQFPRPHDRAFFDEMVKIFEAVAGNGCVVFS